jgi:CBS domain-containing protein
VNVAEVAVAEVVSVDPGRSLRDAARTMVDRGVGSVVVLEGGELVGILTERDLLRAAAGGTDLDATPVADLMTREVVTIGPDWRVEEAAVEMASRRIRHLVVTEDGRVRGVVSIRDLLLAGRRVDLSGGHWAILRDPRTLAVRERRRLQRALLDLRTRPAGGRDWSVLLEQMVTAWSLDLPVPPGREVLGRLSPEDRERLEAAVVEELPGVQRTVHPSPGWRRARTGGGGGPEDPREAG